VSDGGQGAIVESAGGTAWYGDDGGSSGKKVTPVPSGAGQSLGDGAGITPAITARSAAKSPELDVASGSASGDGFEVGVVGAAGVAIGGGIMRRLR
jgi:hypothetical protein